MPVYLLDGQVLVDIGSVATSEDCCCGCPETPCPGAQSSGLLIVGATYIISAYVSGDDFTNVGASSNTNGEIFAATGTTPAVWTNGSALVIYLVYVNVSGVLLCPCHDTGGGAFVETVDGHHGGFTGPGINSQWIAVNDFSNHWQGATSNFVDGDPYFSIIVHTEPDCSDVESAGSAACIINVSCLDDAWTVNISYGGFTSGFNGSGCSSYIENDFVSSGDCSGSHAGYLGTVEISFTP